MSVVIPLWNGRDLLLRLLSSLRAQTYPIAEIIAVDNGSTDGAPEFAAREGARVLPMGANLGFARAANAGIEACRTPALGAVVEWCDQCQYTHTRYRSCRDRHCPKCQGEARVKWLQQRYCLGLGYGRLPQFGAGRLACLRREQSGRRTVLEFICCGRRGRSGEGAVRHDAICR